MGATGPREERTTNPTGLMVPRWLLSEICGNQRQNNLIFFLFVFLTVWPNGSSWKSTGAVQPLQLQWRREEQTGKKKMNNIMIYDKDDDQKTVNLKLRTVRFMFFFWLLWIGKNWTTIKIVFKLNSICYTDVSGVQETAISLDITRRRWEGCSPAPRRYDGKYLYS